eukprot:TRINITY_DN10731_c0_g1_i1.p1 TRINITY_DN10731_c0_g1~~TRINITY_DN10731_c0_g1_i1.p1  ORF type:complete len:391 (+),score=40.01 TRINITY_DN10731_c0_g1_i1:54-1226(+)
MPLTPSGYACRVRAFRSAYKIGEYFKDFKKDGVSQLQVARDLAKEGTALHDGQVAYLIKKCGEDIGTAELLLKEFGKGRLKSCTALLALYGKTGNLREATLLAARLRARGMADKYTFTHWAISASKHSVAELFNVAFVYMWTGFTVCTLFYEITLSTCLRRGEIGLFWAVLNSFDRIHGLRNLTRQGFSDSIAALAYSDPKAALKTARKSKIQIARRTRIVLIEKLVENGEVEEAEKLVDVTQEDHVGVLAGALYKADMRQEAELWLKKCEFRNPITYESLLCHIRTLPDLAFVKDKLSREDIHATRFMLLRTIDVHTLCGDFISVERLVSRLSFTERLSSLSSLLCGYAEHGDDSGVFSCIERISSINPFALHRGILEALLRFCSNEKF